jgi:CRP-like cAMP-binding protein
LAGNRLLDGLPPDVLSRLLPDLTMVELARNQPIYHTDGPIDAVYFPDAGMISLVSRLEDGAQVEVGVVGREGMVGISLLAGIETSFVDSMVQMPGRGRRMSAAAFRHEVETSAPFRQAMLRYNDAMHAQVTQTAACNGRHDLEPRLCRWLLMCHDRADGDELPLTQDFIAMMLGVHRPSVTVAAGILQRAGLIRYGRGSVTVLDRQSLEQAACECYANVQRRFVAVLGAPVGKHASGRPAAG